MSSNEEQRKLIFLVGPTGSGKSKLKETIIKDLEYLGNIDCISVDDIFEKDGKSKDIFYKLYEYHFIKNYYSRDENVLAIINDPMKADDEKYTLLSTVYEKFKEQINLPINYNNYLGIINTALERADIKNCVIPQIGKRYGLNNDELPFSHFTSAVYFALREKYLNKKFDERINYCIDNKKDIIIESNGEHINSIIGWYQKTNVTDSYDNDECKTPSLDLRDEINEKYEKHVYFLYRPLNEVKKSMISRAFINMNNFLNDKDKYNIPRLPEIEDDILKEKFQKICSVYDEINEHKNTYGITTLNVYNNLYADAHILPSIEKNENEYKYCIPETEIKKLKNKYSVPAAKALEKLKHENPRKVKCDIIINIKGKLYNKLTKKEINSVPPNCCCDNKEKPCTNGPCTDGPGANNGGRGKKRKKYTQKKQRHFKTRRNYKPKKSRKKNTKKRNRKAKHQ